MNKINDLKKSEYGCNLFVFEGNFYSAKWNKMDIIIDEEKDIDYAEKCIVHFETMSNDMIQSLCHALMKYCEKIRQLAIEHGDDFNVPIICNEKDILSYVSFSNIHIEHINDHSIIGYSVEGSCKWELEHGVQIIIRGNDILYVGMYDGVSVWEEKNSYIGEWNFA